MEPITLVVTTWLTNQERINLAVKTLKSWVKNLKYEGELRLHVADDGSTLNWNPEKIWKGTITYSRQERRGVGASLNAGFREAYKTSPFIWYAVDDWILEESLDLTPWVYLLQQREDVGIVRLGPPHPYIRGTIMPMTELWQGWGIELDRYGLTVGHRPMLFHRRWTEHYGWHIENVNAQECERLMSVQYANLSDGPSIVYALPHKFFHYHLDVIESTSGINPKDQP